MKEVFLNPGDHGHPNQITLIFIVSGDEVQVSANKNAPLKTAVLEALKESENVGQDLSNWQVRNGSAVLDINKKIEDLGLTDGATLSLNPRTGEGGCL